MSPLDQKIGVLLPGPAGTSKYLLEVLWQQGFACEVFDHGQVRDSTRSPDLPGILVVAGHAVVGGEVRRVLEDFVAGGGGLLVVGPVEGLDGLVGAELVHPRWLPFPVGGTRVLSLGEGYLHSGDPRLADAFPGDWWPLHGFGCHPLANDAAEVLATYETTSGEADWPGVTLNGTTMCFAVDVVRTVRFVQEGRYVDQDGLPPADGMAPIEDGILKAEDGLVLDWARDRRVVSPGHGVPAFTVPVADAWRALLTRCLEVLASRVGFPLRRADFWPRGARFVGLLSHDSDGNDPGKAERLLAEVDALGIHTTWCLQPPGYTPDLCARIEASGHELAFHFDAQSFPGIAAFEPGVLREQYEETVEFTGAGSFYSNKNHYTRWEGRVQFLEWCAELGIRVDQSKGPSKCGTLGFPFGTCHPWLAMDSRGEVIECLELGFQSQDFGLQGPADTGPEILRACREARGVAHVIFHPAHVVRDDVRESMRQFVNEARELGAAFMTSREIGEWYFARRSFLAGEGAPPAGLEVLEFDPAAGEWKKSKVASK
ncbi:MAG: hypothetical protein ACTSU5_17165 [Promethearchaeota archaeon]